MQKDPKILATSLSLPLTDQVKSRQKVDSKKWIDLFVCRLAGKKSFVIKSLTGGEKELIDQQQHLNTEKYEDLATSLRISSVKTIITAKRIFNQFGCSSNGTLGQRCWL